MRWHSDPWLVSADWWPTIEERNEVLASFERHAVTQQPVEPYFGLGAEEAHAWRNTLPAARERVLEYQERRERQQRARQQTAVRARVEQPPPCPPGKAGQMFVLVPTPRRQPLAPVPPDAPPPLPPMDCTHEQYERWVLANLIFHEWRKLPEPRPDWGVYLAQRMPLRFVVQRQEYR